MLTKKKARAATIRQNQKALKGLAKDNGFVCRKGKKHICPKCASEDK